MGVRSERVKKWLVVVAALGLMGFVTSEVLAAGVGGYWRRDGTYVQPHMRTNPDGNPYNNYGFPGNYNPNTGRTTPGNPDTYLDRYYGNQGSFGGYGTQNPYGFNPHSR
jgi:hypothetical protein